MDVVAAVIGTAVSLGYRDKLELLGTLADTQYGEWIGGQGEFVLDTLLVEGTNDESAEAKFGSLESHGLERYAEVDQEQLVLGNGSTDDDESFGFGAREWQMEFRQSGTHLDI